MALTSVESLAFDRDSTGPDDTSGVSSTRPEGSVSDRFDRRNGASVQIRLLGGIAAETADGEAVEWSREGVVEGG